MKRRSLVLGAEAKPFEGRWVSVGDAESWRCEVSPPLLEQSNVGHLEVKLSNGAIIPLPISRYPFSGDWVRFVLDKAVDEIKSLCVFVQEDVG